MYKTNCYTESFASHGKPIGFCKRRYRSNAQLKCGLERVKYYQRENVEYSQRIFCDLECSHCVYSCDQTYICGETDETGIAGG